MPSTGADLLAVFMGLTGLATGLLCFGVVHRVNNLGEAPKIPLTILGVSMTLWAIMYLFYRVQGISLPIQLQPVYRTLLILAFLSLNLFLAVLLEPKLFLVPLRLMQKIVARAKRRLK